MDKSIRGNLSCDDIVILLKEMRAIDDKIIYQLNLATPTASFRNEVDPSENCKDLFSQLNKTYQERNGIITNCMNEYTSSVRKLAEKFKADEEDILLKKKLRAEQNKLRDLKNELCIEEIIRQRSLKAFKEKCKMFFNPTSM